MSNCQPQLSNSVVAAKDCQVPSVTSLTESEHNPEASDKITPASNCQPQPIDASESCTSENEINSQEDQQGSYPATSQSIDVKDLQSSASLTEETNSAAEKDEASNVVPDKQTIEPHVHNQSENKFQDGIVTETTSSKPFSPPATASANTEAVTAPSKAPSTSLPTGTVTTQVKQPSNLIPNSSTLIQSSSSLVSLEERLATCGLPEAVEDAEFDNKLKVFTNYRNFGAMYQSKNNFKKAEWAFKNGIKQAVGCESLRSKEQLRAVIGAELEFRLQRAKALVRLGQQSEAKVECSTVLIIDSSNTEAPSLLSSLT